MSVGESILVAKRIYPTTDLNNVKDPGLVFAEEGVPNTPAPYVYVLTLVTDTPSGYYSDRHIAAGSIFNRA